MFKKPLAILLSTLMATAAIVGVSAPAQATGLNVTFPTGVEDQFTPATWQTVATVTSVTPAITGTVSPDQVRVTVSAGNSGFLRIETTGVAAAYGYNLTNFNLANSTGAGTISFTGTVAQANTALATLQFRKVAVGGSEITVRVSQGAGVVFGDRYYEVFNAGVNIPWYDALKAAASKKVPSSVAGVECQGYLVTVESALEQAFLADAVRTDSWLGASDHFPQLDASQNNVSYGNQAAAEGLFHWVNGPSRGTQLTTSNGDPTTAPGLVNNVYNNWNSDGGTSNFEPNNSGATEHFAQLLSSGLWNDLAENGNVSQYVVEYGGLIADPVGHQILRANVDFTNPAHMGTAGACVPAAASQSVTASFIASSAAASYNAANQDLDFNKATQVIGGVRSALLTQNSTGVAGTTVTSGTADLGVAFGINDYVEYYDVITIGGVQIDARVKITAATGIESSSGAADNRLEKLDDYTGTTVNNRWIKSEQTYDSGIGDAYVEYTIEFFVDLASAPVPVALENFELSVYDIDGYQYFEASEFDRYSLGQGTILTTSAPRVGVTRFAETAGTNSNSSNMNSRATVEYDSVSSFIVRLGQHAPANDPQNSASYDLDFGLGAAWGGAQLTPVVPPVFNPNQAAAPYEGPVLGTFSDRTLDPCTPKSITITGTKLSGAKGSIQGKAVTVLENTDTKLVIATPAGLTPARGVDLVITSPYGTLTHQNAFEIPAGVCSQTLSKGRWTQIQSDGKTVKMYAKDPIGDGKIQFFVDGKELAWVNAVDATDPKLSFASSFPYLVRSVDLKAGKNRFEIRVDGKRVWRATYVPRG